MSFVSCLIEPYHNACADLAKQIGLDTTFSKGKFILPDDKLLDTKLKDLGFTVEDVGKEAVKRGTLRDVEELAEAITNFRTATTYVFQSAINQGLYFLGNTVFHEALHQKYGDHVKIANALGLTYDKKAKSKEARANSAEDAVNDFVNSGCLKK